MNIRAIKTTIFRPNEDLAAFILKHAKKIPEKSVIVVSSKVVALSEGRVADAHKKTALIKKESVWSRKTESAWLTEKDGMIMANAGIDESNGNGKLVLLPKDSFRSAALLRKALQKKFKVKHLGVVIADSALIPLRTGVTAAALGYAGFKGVRDYRGKKDIFGKKMKISRTNIADSLATAASLVMGEGAERQPFALIANAPVEFVEHINRKELRIAAKKDLFWPVLKKARLQ